MPRLTQTLTQTVEVTQTVTLSPQQTLRLRKALRNYQRVSQKRKALEVEAKASVGDVEDIMAEVGVEALDFEGFKSKIVAGTRKKFDPQLFVKKGGNLKLYNDSMVEAPVSAYVKIHAPNEKDE